jgi:ABC-2 type transport system permease protein
MKPGSFLWFLAHDMRQHWRSLEGLFGGMSRGKVGLLLGAAILALHGLAYPAALWLNKDAGDGDRLPTYVASGVLFILPWIVAQAMTATTRALYARGDLDLLFAAPVSARAVLAARAVAIAADGVASVAILLLPLANMNVALGHWRWLAVYPALIATGLFGAGLGIALALALFSMVAPRRARLASQIAATLIGACFVLGLQALSMLPSGPRTAVLAALAPPQAVALDDPRSLVWLPALAASGDGRALILWSLVGLVVFTLAALSFGRRFAAASVLSAGAPAARASDKREQTFRASLGATLRAKERRLLIRDPWLMSQIALQIVYTLPVSVILWRNGGATGSAGVAFAPSIVVIAAQLAGSLAWLALSGEDAPEFLATAPVTRAQIERRKIEAIALPIVVLLALPLVGLALASPWSALLAALFALGAGVSTALLNLWRQAPARRTMVLRRHSQSKLVGLIEHLLSILWAVGAVIAIIGSWTAIVPLAMASAVLWLNRPRAARAAPSRRAEELMTAGSL